LELVKIQIINIEEQRVPEPAKVSEKWIEKERIERNEAAEES